MPTVPRVEGPQIEQTNLPSVRLGARQSQVPYERVATAAEQIGGELTRIGVQDMRRAQDLAEKEKRKADQSAILAARGGLLDIENNEFDPKNPDGVYSFKGKDALGAPDAVLPRFDKRAKEIRDRLGNDDQRFAFDELSQAHRNRINDRITSYMVPENERYQVTTYESYRDTSRETASQAARSGDVGRFRAEKELFDAATETFADERGLPESWVREEQGKWTNAAHGAAIFGLLAEDKLDGAKKYLKANEGEILEDTRSRALNAIVAEQHRRDAEAKQNAAIAKADFQDRVQNASTMALALGSAPNAPTKAEFYRVYGAAEGERRYADFEVIQRAGSEQQQIRGMDWKEQDENIAATKPTENTPNFHSEQQAWEQKVQLTQRARTEFHSDPAAYVIKNTPAVRDAYQLMTTAKNPEVQRAASNGFYNAMRAEQERITGGQSGKVLPEAYIDSVASSFGKLSDEKPADAARLVRQLEFQWGDKFMQVYKELSPKLPGVALAVASGMDDRPASMLVEAWGMKGDDLTAGLPSSATKDITEALRAVAEPFGKTVRSNAGGQRTFSVFFENGQKLGLSYMRQGKSAPEAARAAWHDIMDHKYEYADTYRIPYTFNKAVVDTHAVDVGAQVERANFDATGVQIPTDDDPGYTPEQTRERYQERMRTQGSYWVTSPDEDGLILYGPSGEAVLMADGKTPYLRTWAQLANPRAAAARSAETADFERYNPTR